MSPAYGRASGGGGGGSARLSLGRLRGVDFYKKVPADLTEATLTGAGLSIAAATVMALLLVLELSAFLRVRTATELAIDRSPSDELLRVEFNVSFPALSCEFATLDVSDALGTKRMNLTKTVTKTPVDLELRVAGAGSTAAEVRGGRSGGGGWGGHGGGGGHKSGGGPKYDPEGAEAAWWDGVNVSVPLTSANFEATLARYPILVVDFFAPWCIWCQRLAPAWEAAAKAVHDKYPEGSDGRIRYAKVDCTQDEALCRRHFITGFPSIRVFRRGHDDIYVEGTHQHESYLGDRTKDELVAFADSLVLSAGAPHAQKGQLVAAPKVHGCNLAGFALVNKVPGTLHFVARGEGHSFGHAWMNVTHKVHSLRFGARPAARQLRELRRLRAAGGGSGGGAAAAAGVEWMDRLAGRLFFSDHAQHTHEHVLQVVATSIEGRGGRGGRFQIHEYNAHSHTYMSDATPSAKVTFTPAPVRVVVRELPRAWYHFLTTTCAVLGGVFTVAGILDAICYKAFHLAKKIDLGKQG